MTVLSPVSTFLQPNYSGDQPGAAQTGTGYPLAIDAAIRALTRTAEEFAPRQATSPGMTIMLDPGHVWSGTTLTEVGIQTSGTITAPVTYPRIDRLVIDRLTGTLSIITGTENASPTPPAIPPGSVPIAQIALQISTTAITNSLISDERDFTALGGVPGAFGPQTSLASASISDLGTVASQNVLMTGTATISGLGSSAHINAPLYLVKFAAALTLTYNATSLILPGAVNITTAAGDAGLFEYLGSGNWKCQGYFPASGKALVTPAAVVTVKRQVFTAAYFSSVVTISIASPAVITMGNSFVAGTPIVFSTSGALPSGITAGTLYYVIAAGLSGSSFQISATFGGSAVNTSGSQSGTQTIFAGAVYVPSAGMLYCDVEGVGGGGGGGGVKMAATAHSAAAGGGQGGSYIRYRFSAATIGASQPVYVAQGGIAGGNTGGSGSNGGSTYFGGAGALLSVGGGAGGTGSTSTTSTDYNLGGQSAGAGGSFDYTATGSFGGAGFASGANTYAGMSGYGGAPPAYGSITPGVSAASGSAQAGNSGLNYGSGGSGAYAYNTTTGTLGGNGAPGILIITEFCSQ